MAERFKAPVLKTGVHSVDREFESRPLRQISYWLLVTSYSLITKAANSGLAVEGGLITSNE